MKAILAFTVTTLIVVLSARFSAAQDTRGQAQPASAAQSRTDHVVYTMPSGWKRQEKEGYTALVPPNVPEGKSAEIRLVAPIPVAGNAEGNARRQLEQLKAKYVGVQATPV